VALGDWYTQSCSKPVACASAFHTNKDAHKAYLERWLYDSWYARIPACWHVISQKRENRNEIVTECYQRLPSLSLAPNCYHSLQNYQSLTRRNSLCALAAMTLKCRLGTPVPSLGIRGASANGPPTASSQRSVGHRWYYPKIADTIQNKTSHWGFPNRFSSLPREERIASQDVRPAFTSLWPSPRPSRMCWSAEARSCSDRASLSIAANASRAVACRRSDGAPQLCAPPRTRPAVLLKNSAFDMSAPASPISKQSIHEHKSCLAKPLIV